MGSRSTYQKSCACIPTTSSTTHTLSNLNFVFFFSLSSDSLALPLCSLNLGILFSLCALLGELPALKVYLTSYACFPVLNSRASLSVILMPTAAHQRWTYRICKFTPTPNLRNQTLWLFCEIVYFCGFLPWTCDLPDSVLVSVLGFGISTNVSRLQQAQHTSKSLDWFWHVLGLSTTLKASAISQHTSSSSLGQLWHPSSCALPLSDIKTSNF